MGFPPEKKDGISIAGCQQIVFYSIFSQIRTIFEHVQGPCTMNVRNEPLHDMACVVKSARTLNVFENGSNLAENRIEYDLLTTCDGNPIFFLRWKSHLFSLFSLFFFFLRTSNWAQFELGSNWARAGSNWARAGSQKIPLNGFTEWNFLGNKKKAYENREFFWFCRGVHRPLDSLVLRRLIYSWRFPNLKIHWQHLPYWHEESIHEPRNGTFWIKPPIWIGDS